MYFNERNNQIIEILKERNTATVRYLANKLFVSEPTIRRALSDLEKGGKIKRTFGGAVLSEEINKEIPLILREQENVPQKREIAVQAAKKIRDGQLIFIDASSTASYLVDQLSPFKNLTVVTNSPKISLKLSDMKIKCYCTGGLLLEHSISYVGTHAERFVNYFNADVMFFSCRGLSFTGELTDQSIEESQLRQAMLSHSNKKFMLCTSEKFGKKYSFNLCSYKDIDEIISDVPFVLQSDAATEAQF